MPSEDLTDLKIAILAADGVEQVELTEPRKAVEDAGATTELLSIAEGEIQGMEGDINKADTFAVDKLVGDANVDDYAGLIVPGGVANPDNLRADENAVQFVKDFFATGKPVGTICHGPWILVEADVARGRTVTSYPSIRTDLRNAGAEVVDEEVVCRPGPGHQPQPGRPAGLLREDRGGVRRGRAPGGRRGRDGRVARLELGRRLLEGATWRPARPACSGRLRAGGPPACRSGAPRRRPPTGSGSAPAQHLAG